VNRSANPSTPFHRAWPLIFLFLGLVGLADATFLTARKLTNGPLPCFNGTACETVTNSTYATIGPVPVSALGMGYYLMIVVVSLVVIDSGQAAWLRRLSFLTWAGFLFSIYLVSIMAFVLHAWCLYCLISAGTSGSLFIVGLFANRAATHPDKYGPLPPIQ
jgi:uncharacterized membrane protein